MEWRTLVAVVAVLWMVGCGSLPQLQTMQLLSENNHVLRMTALCDIFEMKGLFKLEFNKIIDYEIKDPEKDSTLADFEYLEIVANTNTISIDDKKLNKSGKFRIRKPQNTTLKTKLKVLSDDDVVQWLWIKQVMGRNENAKIVFSHSTEKQSIPFGEDYIVYLENCLNPNHWTLRLEGQFKVVQVENDVETSITEEVPMTEAKITFTGSLGVVSPKVHKGLKGRVVGPPHLEFKLSEDVNRLSFEEEGSEITPRDFEEEGNKITLRAEAPSEASLLPIQFEDVIEDDFKINMDHEYYKTKYRKEFHLLDIKKMIIEKIRKSDERLKVTLIARYGKETLFPKIKINTKYIRIDSETKAEILVGETSNLETTDETSNLETTDESEEPSESRTQFLYGEEYKVFILIETLVKDDIIVHLVDENSDDFEQLPGHSKSRINISLGPHNLSEDHDYSFRVIGKIGEKIECKTRVWSQDSRIEMETKSLEAEISSDIDEYIYIKEREDDEEKEENEKNEKKEEFKPIHIVEGEIFRFRVEIGPKSETSAAISVKAFIIPSEGFEIVDGQLYDYKDLEEEPLTLEVSLIAPITNLEENRDLEIKVVAYYCINDKPHDILCKTKRVVVGSAPCYKVFFRENFALIAMLISYMGGSILSLISVLRLLGDIRASKTWRSMPKFFWPDNELIRNLSESGEDSKIFEIKKKEVYNTRLAFLVWLSILIAIVVADQILKWALGPYWWLLG